MKSAFKKEKIATVYKSVRGSMRTLGSLYSEFFSQWLESSKTHGNSLDTFMRDNFDQLCDAIDMIMATAKVVLFDKNAVKKAKGHHYQKKNEDINWKNS